MKAQNYNNHIFYYLPHHVFFYGALLIGFVLCGIGIWQNLAQWPLWCAVIFILVLITWLALMVRQHYALGNQNRTVRLEMRLRYYILTGRRLEEIESKLSFKQLAALRFASDAELPALVSIAVAQNLPPDEIKKRIKNWYPDTMRV